MEPLRRILRPGGGFNAYCTESNKYRYFFVLNKDPLRDKTILLVTPTTKIAYHVRKYRRDYLVMIEKGQHPNLKNRCLINCSRIISERRAMFEIRERQGAYNPINPLPLQIMEQIRNAVRVCDTLEKERKIIILGCE